MPSLFQPKLLNGHYGDPVVELSLFGKSFSYLIDLGEISSLTNRSILKIKRVFVSHPHMDHFFGFDKLLRIFLGKEKTVHIYGPDGIIKCVEGKLNGYIWNLVHNYKNNLKFVVYEIHPRSSIIAEFLCREKFKKRIIGREKRKSNIIVEEDDHIVKCEILEHRIPSLCFMFEEKFKINILKNKLIEAGFEVGPWLKNLKQLIYENKLNEGIIYKGKKFLVKDLKDKITKITEGKKIAYITDLIFSKKNLQKIKKLGNSVSILYIETTFSNKYAKRARERYHLTARQAGYIARMINAKKVIPIHISPIHSGNFHQIRRELENEWKKRNS